MRKGVRQFVFFSGLSLLMVSVAEAGLRDWMDKLLGEEETSQSADAPSASGSAAVPSTQETVSGLKQALSKGVDYAVALLGKENGFLNNDKVRIPMPDSLQRVEKTLRKLGAERYADDFVETMNHAAEDAVKQATPIFASAIKNLTVEDAMDILRGPDDAATQYFRRHTEASLVEKMLPITKQATAKAGVTQSYKTMVDNLGFAKQFLGDEATDIDAYVTNKTVDGLFVMIAEEEKKIRNNPLERTTDLLKKVFEYAKQ